MAAMAMLVGGCASQGGNGPESFESPVPESNLSAGAAHGDAGPEAWGSQDGGALSPSEGDYLVTLQGDAPVAEADAPVRMLNHASTGWLDVSDSPVHPWCAAVLVRPDVALTAARCADSGGSRLRFGTGVPGEGRSVNVARVERSSDGRLAALVLETPLNDMEPASLSAQMKKGKGGEWVEAVAVEGVAMGFVGRGDPSERWTWTGTLLHGSEGLVVELPDLELDDFQHAAEASAPNCHGDNGAGVYRPSGELVGLVVGAEGDDQNACIHALRLAGVGELVAALQLSVE